ncbi:MAG: hypothetical protein MPEBLZ_04368, partial [Candidatus Methanoperedens nitroreducens]
NMKNKGTQLGAVLAAMLLRGKIIYEENE